MLRLIGAGNRKYSNLNCGILKKFCRFALGFADCKIYFALPGWRSGPAESNSAWQGRPKAARLKKSGKGRPIQCGSAC